MELLKKAWRLWKKLGQMIGDLIGRVFLTIFYFTIFVPFGLGSRLFGDALDIRRRGNIQWIERTTGDKTLEDARRLH